MSPEERQEAEEWAFWVAAGKGVGAGVLLFLAVLGVWAYVAPDYSGPWLAVVMVLSFAAGPIGERLTR